jgi:lysine 2,3-aminomutase
LSTELPARLPAAVNTDSTGVTRDEFLQDVEDGMSRAPMAVRLTPHILSVADWSDPLNDPIRCQFLPLKSTIVPDHPKLTLDSLHETDDSPVEGLVHRYPDKVLFLGRSLENHLAAMLC